MARLNERTIIWLATTRPDGRPHLTANFRKFTSTCPPRATAPWTDVHPGAVVELRVLEAVGRVQLAVRARRVVEQLGQRPHDWVVAVEHLVVVPGRPTEPSFATTVRLLLWPCGCASRWRLDRKSATATNNGASPANHTSARRAPRPPTLNRLPHRPSDDDEGGG